MLMNRKSGEFLDKALKNKGFTIVELMTTFILVAIISSLLIKLVITLKEVYINGDMKTTLITKQSTMTDKIYKDLKEKELTKIEKCSETNCVNFVYKDTTKKFVINKNKKTVTYDNYTIKLGREGYLGEISLDKYNSDIGFILNFKVPIYNRLVKGNYGINITYQLDNDIEFDNEIVFDVIEKGVTVTFDDNINLIENGDFRQPNNEWKSKNNGNGTIDENVKYNNSNSMRICGSTSWAGILTKNNIPFEPDTNYRLSFKAYRDSTSSYGDLTRRFDATIEVYDSNNNRVQAPMITIENSSLNNKTWKDFSIEFKTVSNGSKFSSLIFNYNAGNASSCVWITDVELIKKGNETKQVTVGQNYGKLPIPEREGYKFLGWNGKNMFDEKEILMAIPNATYENGYYKFHTSYAYSKYLYGIQKISNFKNNTAYTIKLKGHVEKTNYDTFGYYISFKYTDGTSDGLILDSTSDIELSKKSNSEKTINYIYMSFVNPCYVYLDYIQLEEGDTATEYEPYYVQNNTKVTQNKNHTLKAIWEKDLNYVPKEYQKAEYIESTGTQYVDTGVIANQDTGFEIKFKTNNIISTSSWGTLFGARQSSTVKELQLTTYANYSTGTLRYGAGKGYAADIGSLDSIQTVSLKNKVYTGNSGSTQQLTGDFTTPVPLTIFALNQNGDVVQYGSLRLYSFKLYNGNNLVRNYIPVYKKSDNTIGLYETIEGKFYTNQGTGTFEKGKNIK